ncbi:MAG: TRAP transporter TAXI family solute receptor [Gammaproteobacteria bacterium]|jgi:TRAP transporter TAXI family solute receptor
MFGLDTRRGRGKESFDNDVIRKRVADNAYYAMAEVPGGMYKGTDSPVTTFGVGATFVSSSKTDTETVYQMAKAVFDNIARFRKMHPAFATLQPDAMIVKNLSAPLHDGAAKYYKEKGWIK